MATKFDNKVRIALVNFISIRDVNSFQNIKTDEDIFLTHEVLISLFLFIALDRFKKFSVTMGNHRDDTLEFTSLVYITMGKYHVIIHFAFIESFALVDFNNIKNIIFDKDALFKRCMNNVSIMFSNLVVHYVVNYFSFLDKSSCFSLF